MERQEFPALRGRSRDDRRGGVHEHHLEKEHKPSRDVLSRAAQKKASLPKQSPRFPAIKLRVNSSLSDLAPPRFVFPADPPG